MRFFLCIKGLTNSKRSAIIIKLSHGRAKRLRKQAKEGKLCGKNGNGSFTPGGESFTVCLLDKELET